MGAVTKDYLFDTFENPTTNISQAINFIENDANGFYRIEYAGMANLGIAYEQSTFIITQDFKINMNRIS